MRKLALVVGIETYRDAGIAPLRFAVHDATALAEALSDECRFDSVRTLAGEEGPDEPTATNILTALDSLTKDANDGDLFLFFFAGHGIEQDKHTLLLTRDAYSRSPGIGSLPMSALQETLPQHVGARILLIDACRNSPYAARGDLPNTLTDVVARDIRAAAKRSTTRHGTTAVLFACAPGQRAYEWPDKKHGVFTHYLLEGLRNPPPEPPWTPAGLTVQGLAHHVTERVSRWSNLTPNLPHPQQPWYLQEGQPGDIQLASYAGATDHAPADTNTAVVASKRSRETTLDSSDAPHATPATRLAPRARLVALKKAINANDVGAVETAIAAGVDVDSVDAGGSRPLHLAAKVADGPGIVRALIDAGADVNAVDGDGSTPLGIAARSNANPDVHRALLHAGADIEGSSDFTPLMAAAAFNTAEVVRALIALHADHEARDSRGRTPLMWAAWINRSVAVTQALLDTCASDGDYVLAINEKSQDGTTALGYALHGLDYGLDSRVDIIQVLLRAGANPHIATHPVTGKTAVQTALDCGAGNPLLATIQPYASRSPKPPTPPKPKRRAKRRSKPTSPPRQKRAAAPRSLGRVVMESRGAGIVFVAVAILGVSLVAFGQYPQFGRDALGRGLELFQRSTAWIRELPSSVTRRFAEPTFGGAVAPSPSPLAAGEASSLIVDAAGRVWATGSNWVGNLGDGTTTARSVFTQALFPSDVRIEYVAADGGHVIALDQRGHAWAWGANESGELGDGTRINRNQPVRVQMPNETTFDVVAAGPGFSLALDHTGGAWGWGTNLVGQLGDGERADRYRPTRVAMPANTRFTALAAGQAHVLALDTNGHAWEWGQTIVSDGAIDRLTPTRVPQPSGLRFTAIAAGDRVSFGIDSDGQAWSWGSPGWMMLGTGGWGPLAAPTRVDSPPGVRFVAIAPGAQSVMAIDQNGQAWEWGAVISGMASGAPEDLVGSPAPIAMPASVRFVHVRVARGWDARHALAVDDDGQVWAWGSNEIGQLGTDDPAYRDGAASPILVTSSIDALVGSAEPRPPNDDFGQATPIYRIEGVTSAHNRGATNEPAEPNHAREQGQASVWYAWRSPGAQPAHITFTTAGSTFDTLLYAYKSSVPDQLNLRYLTLVASNDDVDGTFQSRITFEATPNTTYYIAVSGYQGATGDFTLAWGDATRVWDESDFGNAIATGLELMCDGRRAYASSFDGGPYPAERCPASERLAFSRADDPEAWDLSAPWFTFFGSHQLPGARVYFVSWTVSELRGTGGFNNLNVYLQPDGRTPYLAYTIESQTPDAEVYDPRYPDRIMASVREYGPGDANCCPSASTQQVFRATETRLELVERRTVSHVQPSFDCAQAASWSEHAICASPELARLDVALSEAFERIRDSLAEETFEAVRLEQRAWLQAREDCEAPSDRQERIECLAAMTRDRTTSLLSLMEPR